MKILIALLFLISINATAKDKKGFKKLDLPDFSKAQEYDKSHEKKIKKGVHFSTQCTNSTGQVLNHGDTGFADCHAAKESTQRELQKRIKQRGQ